MTSVPDNDKSYGENGGTENAGQEWGELQLKIRRLAEAWRRWNNEPCGFLHEEHSGHREQWLVGVGCHAWGTAWTPFCNMDRVVGEDRCVQRSKGSDHISPLTMGFSTLALLDSSAGYFFLVGDCPVHCRMFNSISGFYITDTSGTPFPPIVTTRNVSRHCQISSEVRNHTQLRTTAFGPKEGLCYSEGFFGVCGRTSRILFEHDVFKNIGHYPISPSQYSWEVVFSPFTIKRHCSPRKWMPKFTQTEQNRTRILTTKCLTTPPTAPWYTLKCCMIPKSPWYNIIYHAEVHSVE